jgi:hypothetical protein
MLATINDQSALYRMHGTVFASLNKVGLASHRCRGNVGEECRHLNLTGGINIPHSPGFRGNVLSPA